MRHKKIMALLTCFCMAAACISVSAADAPAKTITVEGSGNMTIGADQASVNIAIETDASTPQEAAASNASLMTGVRDAVIRAGIEANKIKTSNYMLWPSYQYDKGKSSVSGYRATNSVIVTVNPANKTGDVIDAAIHAGANKINSVTFSMKDTDTYKQQVIRKAINDAKEKADTIAAALDKHVINVLSVSENSVRVTLNRNLMMVRESAVSAETPIEPQDVDIQSDVTVVFEID